MNCTPNPLLYVQQQGLWTPQQDCVKTRESSTLSSIQPHKKHHYIGHRWKLHTYFQSPIIDVFIHLADIQEPHPTIPIKLTPDLSKPILRDKGKSAKSIRLLKASSSEIIFYYNSSQMKRNNDVVVLSEKMLRLYFLQFFMV